MAQLGCTLRSAAVQRKVVNELKQLAEKADHIYLATDLDREGEAIAWHLREVIGVMTNATAV